MYKELKGLLRNVIAFKKRILYINHIRYMRTCVIFNPGRTLYEREWER